MVEEVVLPSKKWTEQNSLVFGTLWWPLCWCVYPWCIKNIENKCIGDNGGKNTLTLSGDQSLDPLYVLGEL